MSDVSFVSNDGAAARPTEHPARFSQDVKEPYP